MVKDLKARVKCPVCKKGPMSAHTLSYKHRCDASDLKKLPKAPTLEERFPDPPDEPEASQRCLYESVWALMGPFLHTGHLTRAFKSSFSCSFSAFLAAFLSFLSVFPNEMERELHAKEEDEFEKHVDDARECEGCRGG